LVRTFPWTLRTPFRDVGVRPEFGHRLGRVHNAVQLAETTKETAEKHTIDFDAVSRKFPDIVSDALTLASEAFAAWQAGAPKDQIAGSRWDDENK
jgi:hypothetical protein